MANKNFRAYKLSLEANKEHELNVAGNMYSVTKASNPFDIIFDESQNHVEVEQGMGANFDTSYSKVTIRSSTAQSIIVYLGYGKLKDSRSSVNANISTTIEGSNLINNPGDVTVGDSASQVIAANANRKSVQLYVPYTSDYGVRIGNSNVDDSSGILIEPGMTREYFDTSAWYAIREASATDDVELQVLELERA